MAQELETALDRVSALELRVRDVEVRLAKAAAALLGLPIPATQPVVEKEPVSAVEQTQAIAAGRPVVDGEVANGSPNCPASTATEERQGSSNAVIVTAGPRSGLDTPSTSSALTEVVAGSRPRKTKRRHGAAANDAAAAPVPASPATTVPIADLAAAKLPTTAVLPPLTAAVAASGAFLDGTTVLAGPVLTTTAPSVSEPSWPAPTAVELAERAPAAVERVEPVSDPSGHASSVESPGGDTHEGCSRVLRRRWRATPPPGSCTHCSSEEDRS